jgi:RNA recognition motif-containing protein
VASVKFARGRDTGQRRGFGFVEMANDTDADKVISGLNGKDVEGRTLNGRKGEV